MMDHIGNSLQIRGIEQYVLQDGKGRGMRFLYVRNGLGLEAWISLDRCADLSRVTYQGKNMGYFSPCGYVAPQYYDGKGDGFLKSFTAGFVTTCGLTAVGSPCTDEGEVLPLHGTVSHIPAELQAAQEEADALKIRVTVRDCRIFGQKLVLKREYTFPYGENKIHLEDTVINEGSETSPYMILYHCNMGYPLLSEKSTVKIPNRGVVPRNDRAASQIAHALRMEPPGAGYEECCYYYDMTEKNGVVRAGIFNEEISCGAVLSYHKTALPCFTQWKMMGKKDYVLGLEPGNCTPDGRDVLRKEGRLAFLAPEEKAVTWVDFCFMNEKNRFEEEF